jgi:predicted GNAT family acetyltransferase
VVAPLQAVAHMSGSRRQERSCATTVSLTNGSFEAMSDVRNNSADSRYELKIDGDLAIAVYQKRGQVVAFTHTEVPQALEGHGVASTLINALADVRAHGLTIIPACEFVAAYLERHPEEQDLLARY